MITALHIPSPRLKKINVSLADQIKSGRYPAHLIIKAPGSPGSYNKAFGKKRTDHRQRQNQASQFKEWCMPEPETGYIKASKHNLL